MNNSSTIAVLDYPVPNCSSCQCAVHEHDGDRCQAELAEGSFCACEGANVVYVVDPITRGTFTTMLMEVNRVTFPPEENFGAFDYGRKWQWLSKELNKLVLEGKTPDRSMRSALNALIRYGNSRGVTSDQLRMLDEEFAQLAQEVKTPTF